jgi:flagellar basal-body rod modification protein FlgD
MPEVAPIPALAGLYSTPNQAGSAAGSTELGKDAFLRLLTTQLKNQDPSDPVRNEDFVAQLAQFSSLEQLTTANDTLTGVYIALAAMNDASMASLLGSGVIARGNGFEFNGADPVELTFNSPTEATTSTLTIYDEDGTVVFTQELGSLASGDGTYSWDGKGIDGQPLPEGTYTFEIEGTDAAGATIDIEERISGIITEMDYSTGAPKPSVGGIAIDLADVLTLTTGAP